MSAVKDFLDSNPQSVAFLLGVVVTLIIVAIIYYIFYKEHASNIGQELAYLHGITSDAPSRLGEEKATDGSRDSRDSALSRDALDSSVDTRSFVDPRFNSMSMDDVAQTEHMHHDKDDVAFELLQGRGTAHRPIGDAAKSRYLGLAQTLGGGDYEGVYDKYQGEPVSDEWGPLVSMGYGINSSPIDN